jgi:hypothetical protein
MVVDMPLPMLVAGATGLWLWSGGAVLTAWVAAEKQRSAFAWFVFGLVFTPPLALLALAAAPDGS